MVEYMKGRANLDAIAILVDCRRGPQDDELDLAALAVERGIEVIPVATKSDKLRRSERAAALKRFDPMRVAPIFCSATSGEGIDDLRRRILAVDRKKAAKNIPPGADNSAAFDKWLKWVFDHPVADEKAQGMVVDQPVRSRRRQLVGPPTDYSADLRHKIVREPHRAPISVQ